MPEKIESYQCVLCKKTHSTIQLAALCEHDHIGFVINDSQIEEVHILGRVYKPVPPKEPLYSFRSEEEQRDWEHTMIIGSNCG
jgi:hypothetical protein